MNTEDRLLESNKPPTTPKPIKSKVVVMNKKEFVVFAAFAVCCGIEAAFCVAGNFWGTAICAVVAFVLWRKLMKGDSEE